MATDKFKQMSVILSLSLAHLTGLLRWKGKSTGAMYVARSSLEEGHDKDGKHAQHLGGRAAQWLREWTANPEAPGLNLASAMASIGGLWQPTPSAPQMQNGYKNTCLPYRGVARMTARQGMCSALNIQNATQMQSFNIIVTLEERICNRKKHKEFALKNQEKQTRAPKKNTSFLCNNPKISAEREKIPMWLSAISGITVSTLAYYL